MTEVAKRFPDARACRYAEDGLVLGRRGPAHAAFSPAELEELAQEIETTPEGDPS